MAKIDLGVKALTLGVGVAIGHYVVHAIGQTVPIITGALFIVVAVVVYTIDMW